MSICIDKSLAPSPHITHQMVKKGLWNSIPYLKSANCMHGADLSMSSHTCSIGDISGETTGYGITLRWYSVQIPFDILKVCSSICCEATPNHCYSPMRWHWNGHHCHPTEIATHPWQNSHPVLLIKSQISCAPCQICNTMMCLKKRKLCHGRICLSRHRFRTVLGLIGLNPCSETCNFWDVRAEYVCPTEIMRGRPTQGWFLTWPNCCHFYIFY